MPAQLTIRGVDGDLAERLKRLAEGNGESVNAAVLRILEAAVGIDRRYDLLKSYETWTAEEAEEFDTNLKDQRRIDDKLWR